MTGGERTQVVLHVDLDTLTEEGDVKGEANLEDGPGLDPGEVGGGMEVVQGQARQLLLGIPEHALGRGVDEEDPQRVWQPLDIPLLLQPVETEDLVGLVAYS